MTDTVTAVDGGRAAGAPPSARRSYAWMGLLPFFAFLTLFLIIPAITIFINSLKDESGSFSFASMKEAFQGQNLDAFTYHFVFSFEAALVGAILGAFLAYAAASVTRPRWLRSLITSFSGVAANMGGLPLAFAFVTLLGARAGVLTNFLNWMGLDIYSHGFDLGNRIGLIVVYSYFNVPLMLLVMLPAIDGLKQSWREACSNLGGTSWTYWRRIGLPVLTPALLGGLMLLFANSFSAYATARVLTDNSKIVPIRLAFFLGGDVKVGTDAVGFSLAAWMILITAFCMAVYWITRRRAERWSS